MVSRVLFVLFTFCICVVSSSRTLAPSLDNSQLKFYVVDADYALYHNDCKKYEQLLEKVIQGRSPKKALLYCYKHVMFGFSAALTAKEAEIMKGEEGILSVTKDKIYTEDDDVAHYDYDAVIEDNTNNL